MKMKVLLLFHLFLNAAWGFHSSSPVRNHAVHFSRSIATQKQVWGQYLHPSNMRVSDYNPMKSFEFNAASGDTTADDSSSSRLFPTPLTLPKVQIDAAMRKSMFSAAILVVLDIIFRRGFLKANISFPSSLAGCGVLFATLLTLPSKMAEALFEKLRPGAALLAKWLPVFFVPSLVTLPLADSLGSTAELIKVLSVIVGGFFFTLLTTAWAVVGVRQALSSGGEDESIKDDEAQAKEAPVDLQETPKVKVSPKPFTDELAKFLFFSSFTTFGASVITSVIGTTTLSVPLVSAFLLSTTISSFVFGARLPQKFTKVVHPLVTCTALTWTAAATFATLTRLSFKSVLRSYRTGSLRPPMTGAGDVLLFLLGPAVVSLAISMYERRRLMRENLAAVGAAAGVSTLGGLFGTALVVRLLNIGSPHLRLSLLSRNITSPLAMAIASILGADVSLAVSMVVVTGLIGANFGASILDAFGIKDAVARGMGIGAAAHGLGTAAFVDEKDAFPFAAIAMALTGAGATVAVSIPILYRAVLQLALG